MKVILIKDVRGCGVNGDIRNVADGYARNFLFPRKMAEPATDEKIKEIEAKAAQHQAERQKEEEQLAAAITSLSGKTVSITARATEKGGLFKTIGASDIVQAIQAQHQVEVPESAVSFTEAIKTVGEHIVHLSSKEKKADLGVVVVAA